MTINNKEQGRAGEIKAQVKVADNEGNLRMSNGE